MRKLSVLFLFAILVSMVPNAWAEPSPWTQKDTYKEKMFSKLDYGVKNIVFGATHIVTEPLHGIQDDGAVGGLKGLATGLYHSVVYMGGGLLHVVTFPITNLDVPIPESGELCPCSKK